MAKFVLKVCAIDDASKSRVFDGWLNEVPHHFYSLNKQALEPILESNLRLVYAFTSNALVG